MFAGAFAGDVLEPNTSKASSILFPVPLDVPLVAGDVNGSKPPPPDGAAEGLPHGDDCACDGGDHGSLLGISDE